jgi:hypothetical protein
MFPAEDPCRLQPNILIIRLQLDERIHHTFLAKQSGPDICVCPVKVYFHYDRAFSIADPPSTYEWLLLDSMLGHQTLFPRSNWIYKAGSSSSPSCSTGSPSRGTISPTIQQAPGAPRQRIPCIPIHPCKRASTATSKLE